MGPNFFRLSAADGALNTGENGRLTNQSNFLGVFTYREIGILYLWKYRQIDYIAKIACF